MEASVDTVMRTEDAEEFVREAYRAVFRRVPEPDSREFLHWVSVARSGTAPAAMLRTFMATPEGRAKHRVPVHAPAGHYYSPIVDPATVRDYWTKQQAATPRDIDHIGLDVDGMLAMLETWGRSAKAAGAKTGNDAVRADAGENSFFPFGDAWVLNRMIAAFRPRSIIEIGSGFSTMCMLGALEEHGIQGTRVTCIEPHPERLRGLLREGDTDKIELRECLVQNVDLSIFEQLGRNDILFVDSSHVLKTGSDVHFEFFHILPRLKEGVFIHFHDCMYPFEYPNRWVFTLNNSWNEIYMLRAFLMYNKAFRVHFWPSLIRSVRPDALERIDPRLVSKCGSAIWLQKQAGDKVLPVENTKRLGSSERGWPGRT